ncbi:SpoIIE family protein phosphatase [bacterium]|nr:SpoIIE family protein phosphatase [bacterium]
MPNITNKINFLKKYPYTISGALIFLFVTINDLVETLTKSVFLIIPFPILRELLIVLGFSLLAYKITKSELFNDSNVTKQIKSILILSLVLALTYVASYFLFVSPLKDYPKDSMIKNTGILLNESIVGLLGTYFYLLIFAAFRGLIFFKQKSSTIRNYLGFIFCLLASIVIKLVMFQFNSEEIEINIPSSDFVVVWEQIKNAGYIQFTDLILGVFMIYFLFANVFRVWWVTHLTMKQKLNALWQFALIFALLTLFASFKSESFLIKDFSIALESLWQNLNNFLVLYPLIAFFYILLQLPTARVFDRKLKEISTLHEIGRSILLVINPHEIGVKVVKLLPEIIECKRAWLEFYDSKTSKFSSGAVENITREEIEISIANSENILRNWIVKNNKATLINEVAKDERVKEFKNLGGKAGSLLAAPIETKNGIIGIIYATAEGEFAFDSEDVTMLNSYANQVSLAFENAKLVKESLEKERLEQEFQIANTVQQRLLPQKLPKNNFLEIGSFSQPATELGGDYYDLFTLGKDKLAVVIADVSGKGASAAFYMAELKGSVNSLSRTYDSPLKILTVCNDVLSESLTKNMFITVTYGIFKPETMEFCFARAGHCPLAYFSAEEQKMELLIPKGLGLGLAKGILLEKITEEKTLKLKPNDVLVFYTDGISEAKNLKNEDYGDERLLKVIEKNVKESAEVIAYKIRSDVGVFIKGSPQYDDITLMVIKVKENYGS